VHTSLCSRKTPEAHSLSILQQKKGLWPFWVPTAPPRGFKEIFAALLDLIMAHKILVGGVQLPGKCAMPCTPNAPCTTKLLLVQLIYTHDIAQLKQLSHQRLINTHDIAHIRGFGQMLYQKCVLPPPHAGSSSSWECTVASWPTRTSHALCATMPCKQYCWTSYSCAFCFRL